MKQGLIILLVSFTLAYGKADAESAVLQVIATEFPPFSGAELPEQGLSIAQLRSFASSNGVEIDVQFMPPARGVNQVRVGNWQSTLIAVPEDTENVATVVYSESTVQYGLITRKLLNTDISNQRIGVIRTGRSGATQQMLAKQGAQLVEVTSLPQAYKMLDAGRVDSVLGVYFEGKAIGAPDAENSYVLSTLLTDIPFLLYLNLNNPLVNKFHQENFSK